jgi:hypothetical protein
MFECEYLCRDIFKLFCFFFADLGTGLPAAVTFFFFIREIMNYFFSGDIVGNRFPSGFTAGVLFDDGYISIFICFYFSLLFFNCGIFFRSFVA